MGNSPTSSRKIVPLWASAKRPSRFLVAPVKALCSWPKNSLSMSVAGIAAQFILFDDLVAVKQLLYFFSQIFGLNGKRTNSLLRFQSFVYVPEDKRIKRLTPEVEAGKGRLRLELLAACAHSLETA